MILGLPRKSSDGLKQNVDELHVQTRLQKAGQSISLNFDLLLSLAFGLVLLSVELEVLGPKDRAEQWLHKASRSQENACAERHDCSDREEDLGARIELPSRFLRSRASESKSLAQPVQSGKPHFQ